MPIASMFRKAVIMTALAAIAPAMAETAMPAGKLERARNQVTARTADQGTARTLAVSNPLFQNETVATGANARAELRLSDDTSLVMGEKSTVLLDEFVYDTDGPAVINLATGAMRFVSSLSGHPGKLTIKTPAATIGVRGTDFWVGPIDGVYGVLLLGGKVDVSNPGGSVTLDTPRTGTLIQGADIAPGPAVPWPDDRRVRALSKTDF